MEKKLVEFPALLRRWRKEKELARNELASLVGLDGSYIHRLEMGNRRPSRKTAIAIAAALELDEELVNKLLMSAGYGPLPISNTDTVAAPITPASSKTVGSGRNLRRNAARWGTRLEAIGLNQPLLSHLTQAIERTTAKERRRISNTVTKTLRELTKSLEAPVHVAVIPAAGGSHRLIASHVMQRLLIRAIAEAAQCGIHSIGLILAPEMKENFYTPLSESLGVSSGSNIDLQCFIQPRPLGLGDAILEAKKLIDGQPFAVLLPDDVLEARAARNSQGTQLGLMMDVFSKTPEVNLLAVTQVSKRKMPQYGIVELSGAAKANRSLPISKLIEKPKQDHSILESPKAVSIVGRYILQPSVLNVLEDMRTKGQRPIELTTGLEILRQAKQNVRAFLLQGRRQDFGAVLDQANTVMQE